MAATAVFKRTASSAVQFIRHRHFSSTSATNHRTWGVYCDDDSEGEESVVYQHTLKFQRPSTIKQHQVAHNSVSLRGTIELPVKRINTTNGSFGLHTQLHVSAPSLSCPSFRPMLKMWDNIAKMSMDHLKPRDLVYISGNLRSYVKTDKNSTPRLRHEVVVKEITFVTPDVQTSPCAELRRKNQDVQVKMNRRSTGTGSIYGKFSLLTLVSGWISGRVKSILDIQTLNTEIPVKRYG